MRRGLVCTLVLALWLTVNSAAVASESDASVAELLSRPLAEARDIHAQRQLETGQDYESDIQSLDLVETAEGYDMIGMLAKGKTEMDQVSSGSAQDRIEMIKRMNERVARRKRASASGEGQRSLAAAMAHLEETRRSNAHRSQGEGELGETQGGDTIQSLFNVPSDSASKAETNALVEQQKAMLQQQKAAQLDEARKEDKNQASNGNVELGESKEGRMQTLFASQQKATEVAITKPKTKDEIQTANLVKQQKLMLQQQKAAAADNQELGESKKNEMQNLFGTAKKVEKKIVKKAKTAAQLETESLVKQQKAMLKQQKAAAADNQELGESKKNEMQNLFGTAKKVEKKIVKKAKTAAQLETESLVKQQKAMLKQQKAAAADDQEELGESTHGEMKNLFGTSQRAHALTPMEAADRAFQARHQGGDHDSAKLMPAENLDALLGLTR